MKTIDWYKRDLALEHAKSFLANGKVSKAEIVSNAKEVIESQRQDINYSRLLMEVG